MSRERLIHNLRTKRIDERIVRWIESFLSNRTTILKTSEHITTKVNISAGISQGSPLSPILFLFYNAVLLKELQKQKVMACGFVDDVALLVKGDSTEENCTALTKAHDEICMSWARLHEVKFSSPKYQLCHLTKRNIDLSTAMIIDTGAVILPKKEIKYLKILLDSKMN